MYTTINYQTKKELKKAVAEGKRVTYYQPNADVTGAVPPKDGTIYCEGPHYPQPHKWYAECEVKDGVIVRVR